MVEGLGQQDRGDGLDHLHIGHGAVLVFVSGDASAGVCIVLAAEGHDHVENGLAESSVALGIGLLEGGQFGGAGLLEFAGLGHKAI